MPHEFARSDSPPKAGPKMAIVRVKTTTVQTFRIISKAIWGIWTHWNGKASEPCFSEKKDCPGCKRGLPRRWKGYLHCHDTKDDFFLEITPSAAEQIASDTTPGYNLRGLRIRIHRTAGGEKGRLKIEILPDLTNGEGRMPQEKDPLDTLKLLWGIQ